VNIEQQLTAKGGDARDSRKKRRPNLFKLLGPGLITEAADDDPSGIATYSQVGVKLGFGMLWTMLVSYPMMIAVQELPPG
jgi:Mn2+/Fe2+ NRAMP family transporter